MGTGECRRRKVDIGVQCMVWEFQICIINDHGRLLGVTEGSSDHREVCVFVYKGLLGTSQEHKVVYGSPNAWLSSLCACPHACAVYARGSVGVNWVSIKCMVWGLTHCLST